MPTFVRNKLISFVILISLGIVIRFGVQSGTDLRGSERRWNPLGSTRAPGTPPVDLGQKFFLNCLFIKLKVSNIYYWNKNYYKISFSFLNNLELQGVPNGFQEFQKKISPIDNQNPLPIFLNPSLCSVVSIKSINNMYALEYNSDKMAKTSCSIFVNNRGGPQK